MDTTMSNAKQGPFKKGNKVEIHGLQGAKHLNGKIGKLKSFHSSGKHMNRWAVRLDGTDHAIKSVNLKMAEVIEPEPPKRKNRHKVDRAYEALQSNAGGMPGHSPDKNSWAKGLRKEDQYEWFSNCYQMRCDDDYVHGGCNLHGPYDPECTPTLLRDDFMAFCYLADQKRSVPDGWDWEAFLEVAAQTVVFAFAKSDAQQRWGGENVFAAMTGGRSLRYTAEAIYETGVQDPTNSPEAEAAMAKVRDNPSDAVLNRIGGRAAWNSFLSTIRLNPRFLR